YDVRRGDRGAVAAPLALHRDGVLVLEAGGAGDDLDVVAQQLVADHLDLAPDHVLGARQQVGDRDVALDPVARAVQVALGEPGEVEDRLPQRLGRDRAGVDADAAHHAPAFRHADALAQLRGRDRGLLPARAGSDDEQVVVVHATPPQAPTPQEDSVAGVDPLGKRGIDIRGTTPPTIPCTRPAVVHLGPIHPPRPAPVHNRTEQPTQHPGPPAHPRRMTPPAEPLPVHRRRALRIRDQGELVAAIPAVLGFHPRESLVLMATVGGTLPGATGPSGRRLGLTLRADLPPPEHPDYPEHAELVVASAVRGLLLDEPVAAIAVAVSESGHPPGAPPHPAVATAVASAFDARGVPLQASMWAERTTGGARWACYDPCGCAGVVPDP